MVKETTYEAARGGNDKFIRKVGKKNTVTLPKKIVEMLAINESDQVELIVKGNYILMVPVQTVPKDALYHAHGSDEIITVRDIEKIKTDSLHQFKKGELKEYDNTEDMFKDHGW